jgi:hypothetical protein
MRVRSPIDEAISVAIRWDMDDSVLQKKNKFGDLTALSRRGMR